MSAALVSDAAFVSALEAAGSVRLSAYVLNAGGAVARALVRAADRGARVDVTLDGALYRAPPGVARANAATARTLGRHGARVHVTGKNEPAMHLKAAVVDGTAYLDDRNWSTGDRDTIVSLDEPADVAAVKSALAGRPISTASLATEKVEALASEARTIYGAPGDRIDVETESFGATVVSKALAFRAAHGTHVRLLVSRGELDGPAGAPERHLLAELQQAGVAVATTANTEKLCSTGDEAWIGSANATFSPVTSLDWGLRSRDPAIVAGVERAFARNWAGARAPSIV